MKALKEAPPVSRELEDKELEGLVVGESYYISTCKATITGFYIEPIFNTKTDEYDDVLKVRLTAYQLNPEDFKTPLLKKDTLDCSMPIEKFKTLQDEYVKEMKIRNEQKKKAL